MLNKLRVEEGEVVEKVRVDIHDDDLLRRSQVGGHGSKLGVKVRNVFMMFLLRRERLDQLGPWIMVTIQPYLSEKNIYFQ